MISNQSSTTAGDYIHGRNRQQEPMSQARATSSRLSATPASGALRLRDDLTAMTQMQRLTYELNSVCGAPMTAVVAFNGIDAV